MMGDIGMFHQSLPAFTYSNLVLVRSFVSMIKL